MKTTTLSVEIDPEVKTRAEDILESLEIPVPVAINMFYRQIIERREMPFDIGCPPGLPDMDKMTDEELAVEIQKGIDDMNAGRMEPAEKVFEELRRKYRL